MCCELENFVVLRFRYFVFFENKSNIAVFLFLVTVFDFFILARFLSDIFLEIYCGSFYDKSQKQNNNSGSNSNDINLYYSYTTLQHG